MEGFFNKFTNYEQHIKDSTFALSSDFEKVFKDNVNKVEYMSHDMTASDFLL